MDVTLPTTIHEPAATAPALRPGCERRCRGCAHRRLSAADSEQQKFGWLADKLSPWADRLRPVQAVSGAARWGYRERVCLKAQWLAGHWRIGMPLGDNDVLDLPACPVHSRRVNAVLATLKPVLPDATRFPLTYYVHSGRQLVLVLKTARLPETDWLTPPVIEALQTAGLDGLWLHLHPAVGKKIFNKPGWHLLWGKARSQDSAGLRYGPMGFQQLIPTLSLMALDAAVDFLSPAHTDLVVDLYCGNGASLRRWQSAAADSIGVELNGEACACAADNVPQTTTLRGTCTQRLPQLTAYARSRPAPRHRLLYANPPRTGLEAPVRAWITDTYRPLRMAYLSCSAGTLRRDLQELCRRAYRVEQLLPYDFFPHTYHVETLALLQRQSG